MPNNKKLYRSYLQITLPNGERKKLSFSGKTEQEARKKRDQARIKYDAGLLTFSGKTTVEQYVKSFIKQFSLNKDDISRLQRYLVDNIGALRLEEVKAPNIRLCFSSLEGKSKSTISKTCGVINRIFETACADELIVKNPCRSVARPKAKEGGGRRALTETEEKLFLETLKERISDGKHASDIAFGISYACGLRPGEVRGLLRSNIYLDDNPRIKVTQACKDKTRTIGPPKTAAGIREVPIPEWFIPLLQSAINTNNIWVISSDDGRCISHQAYIRHWKRFYNQMKIKSGAKTYRNKIIFSPIGDDLDPYHLRHTYCTNLAYAHIPEVIAMRWMGHDDPNMVRTIYADSNNNKLLKQSVKDLNNYNPLRELSPVCNNSATLINK